MKDDTYWMGIALREAKKAGDRGEIPIGAVVVKDGVVIGRGYNMREGKHDLVSLWPRCFQDVEQAYSKGRRVV